MNYLLKRLRGKGRTMKIEVPEKTGSKARIVLLMKAVVFLTALSVGVASAAVPCQPVAPKEWKGSFKVGFGGFVTTGVFERGGCTWNGLEAVNGFDYWVFEIDGYQKLPVTVTPDASGNVSGYFLNERCERSGFFGPATAKTPASVAVPDLARWMVVGPSSGALATSVTIKAAGIKCPKKKKKKPIPG